MNPNRPNIKPNFYKPPVNPYIRQYGEMLGKLALRPIQQLRNGGNHEQPK